jgi:hypothetical protein
MGAYIDKLKRGLFAVKPYGYTATAGSCEYVNSAEMSTNGSGQVLTIELAQAVKDGNDIQQLSLLNNGQTVYTDQMYPGETHYHVPFTSFELDTLEYSLVLINSDETVIEKTKIRIDEVSR